MCLGNGLKMCILLGCNPQIIFVTFFLQVELSQSTANVNGFKVFSFGKSSNNFMSTSLKLYRCFDHGLKMLHRLHVSVTILQIELSHFYWQSEWIQGILYWQLLLQFYAEHYKRYGCLGHGLKICI